MIAGALMASSLLALSLPAQAAYPEHPVRIVVSNGPGGPVDIMARMLADKLGARWQQSVVVENRPGASGIISTNTLAKAPKDGYTLGMVVASTLTIVPHATSRLPFDPDQDLQPVALVARTPFVFVVPTDSPIQSWEDFIKRSQTGDMSIGSFSVGTAFHLVWEQTARQAGTSALYVPSPTPGKTQSDLLSGLLDIALDTPSSAKGLIDGGRLRALAVTSAQRFAGLPETPTLAESGLNGYAAEPWIGLMAPAGTPEPVVVAIQEAVNDILRDPEMIRQMTMIGMVPEGGTPEQLAASIVSDREEMAPLVKELGISLQ